MLWVTSNFAYNRDLATSLAEYLLTFVDRQLWRLLNKNPSDNFIPLIYRMICSKSEL